MEYRTRCSGSTTCTPAEDLSAYWIPSLLQNGTVVDPSLSSPGNNHQPVTLARTGYDPATDATTYDVTVPTGVITLAFAFRNTAGAVKQVRLLGFELLRGQDPGVAQLAELTDLLERVGLLGRSSDDGTPAR